ncbi:UNVERIFIED_CONTAM: hypothetical protein FKN15_044577 [Acipenser sinensis]
MQNSFLPCSSLSGGPSQWTPPHCDCCCTTNKVDHEGESGTSFNELSTSSSESQSEASSPQETVNPLPVMLQYILK